VAVPAYEDFEERQQLLLIRNDEAPWWLKPHEKKRNQMDLQARAQTVKNVGRDRIS
jgi:hypothetical protein